VVACADARRDGVMPLTTPRMATGETAKSQPTPAQNTVPFDGLEEVAGAGRLEPAATPRATQPREHGRDRPLVKADQKTDDRNHQGARIERAT